MQAHKWHRGKYNNGTDDSTLRNYRDCYSKDGTNCFQGANGGAPSGGELCLQLQKPDHHTLGHCMKLPSSAYEQWVFTADGKLQVKTQTIDLAAVNSLPYVISAAQPAVIYAMPAEPEQQAVPWRYAAPAGGGHRPVHGWRFDDGGAGKHRLIISRCVCGFRRYSVLFILLHDILLFSLLQVLVAGARSRQVYFPLGASYRHYFTGANYSGGTTASVAAPLDHFPLFYVVKSAE